MSVFADQLQKIHNDAGFIAALDQSGGSTPKALKVYGVNEDQYQGEEEMFDAVHAMRTRIMTDESFNGDRILGAILFENTLDREVEGLPTSHYLWQKKHVVPFLKVDKGLEEEANGVQMMREIEGLDELLDKAKAKEVFGTKMRSVIKRADQDGIEMIVAQQFAIGRQILGHGLVPIIEPEIDIHAPDKAAAEAILAKQLMLQLDALKPGQEVMLKLTLPEEVDLYADCIAHPRCLRVVALSGGYSREEANRRLSENHGMVASFSRALSEGLSFQQSDAEFSQTLDSSIQGIFEASNT